MAKGRRRYRHGETHQNAKLSDVQVKIIRKSYEFWHKAGLVDFQAKAWGVHPRHLYNVAFGFRR
jgi:hypothetical protein